MITVTAIHNVVSVARHERLGNGIEALVIDNPTNDYAGFIGAPPALEFNGRVFGRSSFNSDHGDICYRTDRALAVTLQ